MVAWVCVHNMSKFICFHHGQEHLRRHFCSCFEFWSVDSFHFSVSPMLISLLWDTLTGREHLLFYGRLKNLKGAALSQVCNITINVISTPAYLKPKLRNSLDSFLINLFSDIPRKPYITMIYCLMHFGFLSLILSYCNRQWRNLLKVLIFPKEELLTD